MPSDLYSSVLNWDSVGLNSRSGEPYDLIYKAIEHFDRSHYCQYVPTQGTLHGDYFQRLNKWLQNVQDEDQKRILLEFAPNIFFLGRDEFLQLYQIAYQGIIARWVIDILGLSLDDPNLDQTLQVELNSNTWYCPITDSMQISEFHHANNLGGIDYRPDFRSMAQFADPQLVKDFMSSHQNANHLPCPLKRIVLLEDFVGGGTQIGDATNFAASLDPSIPVLILPLVICPSGIQTAEALAAAHSANVRFSAVMEFQDADLITSTSTHPAGSLEAAVQAVARDTYPAVVGNDAANPRPYSAFGCWDTGTTLVMFSNTPANTLSLIHHTSNTWNSLFPRSARIR